MVFDNSLSPSELIAEGYAKDEPNIKNYSTFAIIKQLSQHDEKG